MRTALLFISSVLTLTGAASAAGLAVGRAGGAFTLTDPAGREVSLKGTLGAEGTKLVVVQIASTTCPFSQRGDRDFIPFARAYADRGVRVIALFPNAHEDDDAVVTYATRVKIPYPYARDPGGKVAKAYGAEVTPTFFVFDREGVLRYRGALIGLKAAVDELLAGKPVSRDVTHPVGCSVKWKLGTFVAPPQEGGRPDGPKPLTAAAQSWLQALIERLSSGDEAVVKSATAGIAALGPGAIPHLEKALSGAEGEKKARLEEAIRETKRPRRVTSAVGRRGAGGGRQGFSMLDTQLRALENMIDDLTEEQKKEIRLRFLKLRPLEKEIRESFLANRRVGIRAKMQKLREDSMAVVEDVLTDEQWKRWDNMRRVSTRRGQGERPEGQDPGDAPRREER